MAPSEMLMVNGAIDWDVMNEEPYSLMKRSPIILNIPSG